MIVRGWVNYFGAFYKSALYPTLQHIDRKLARWATRKFKRLRRHRRSGVLELAQELGYVYREYAHYTLLDRAIAIEPDHWQAWYNKVIVYQFDLHEHDKAASSLARLKQLKQQNPAIPDLSAIEREVSGG